MITFKQFIGENELEVLQIELFLQKRYGLSKEERKQARAWVDGELDIDNYPELWQKFYDHYSAAMPYDIAKVSANDFTPEEWVNQMVLHDLKDAGIETHFKPDNKSRPRDSSDLVPRKRWAYDDDF